jgi:3-polyprenyl-4-hydroxybenzoate decarboxylase
MQRKQRIVIGISAASGAILGIELLKTQLRFSLWVHGIFS